MKLSKLVDALPFIVQLSNMNLKITEAFNLKKLNSLLQPNLDSFGECRNTIIEKYSTTNSDGTYTTPPENQEIFKREMVELMNTDIEDFNKTKIEITEDMKFSAAGLLVLEPFIDFIGLEV